MFLFLFANVQVFFTPDQKCLPIVLKQIAKSKYTIFLQCYSFTSKHIALGLIDAHKRGVKVEVISDKSQITARGSMIPQLLKEGIPVYIDNKVSIAHNKVMVFDRKFVITGSYNFTNAAETRNAENMLLIDDKDIAHLYFCNWLKRKQVSFVYTKNQQTDYLEKLKGALRKKFF